MNKLSPDEMLDAISSFAQCYEYLIAKRAVTEVQEIEEFLTTVSLMVPCYSLRPDQIELVNDLIFKNNIISSFMLDLSFRYFTLTGETTDFVQRLAFNIKEGLIVDGPDLKLSIIPKSIAQSCPINIFSREPSKWYIGKNDTERVSDSIITFLVNNRHLMLVYLMYLSAE